MACKVDLKGIEDLASTSPTLYPETPALTATETALLLSMLVHLQYRGRWLYDGEPINDSKWDEAEDLMGGLHDKLLG